MRNAGMRGAVDRRSVARGVALGVEAVRSRDLGLPGKHDTGFEGNRDGSAALLQMGRSLGHTIKKGNRETGVEGQSQVTGASLIAFSRYRAIRASSWYLSVYRFPWRQGESKGRRHALLSRPATEHRKVKLDSSAPV
jgi:hypothetical protein